MDAYFCRRQFRDWTGLEPYADGITRDVYWVTARSPLVGMNGYVMVPDAGHPWSGGFPKPDVRRIDQIPVCDQLTVHGGIVFAQFPWLGFSTDHPGDYWGYEFDAMGVTRRSLSQRDEVTEWSSARVERTASQLASQLSDIGRVWQRAQSTVEWAARVGRSRFKHLDLD